MGGDMWAVRMKVDVDGRLGGVRTEGWDGRLAVWLNEASPSLLSCPRPLQVRLRRPACRTSRASGCLGAVA